MGGGVIKRPAYRDYLESTDWQALREEAIAHADGCCENCGSQRRLDVHHVHYRTLGDESLADLQVLCRSCHEELHAFEGVDEGRAYP